MGMTKLTLTALKKELKAFDQNELIQLIAELYKVSDDVKLYVSNRFMGEEAILALYETTKKKIRHEFFRTWHGEITVERSEKCHC